MVLRGHVSSIKCLKVVQHGGLSHLVSGGGRAQLKVWRLVETEDGLVGTEAADMMLRGTDKAVRQPWRQAQSTLRHDPETRLVSLDTIATRESRLYVFVGCSDSLLRIFVYDQGSLRLYREIEFQSHCVLQVKSFAAAGGGYSSGHGFLAAGTTGGSLFVWQTGGGDDDGDILAAEHGQLKVHQSGINCIDVRHSEDGETSLLVTGGDDNSLVVSSVSSLAGSEKGRPYIAILWRSVSAHAAQITGVHFLGE